MLAKICFVILHYMALEETVNCVADNSPLDSIGLQHY